jgi:3-oxoacyl-(acyl-carrier-protein) synthase
MSRLFVNGIGAVSPVGWSVESLRNALQNGQVPAAACIQRPGWAQPLPCRRVPPPNPVPAIFANARLRRTTPITSFAAGATLQAIADAKADPKTERIGMILCVLAGCVQFTRRFYHEAWKDPSTASPLVFAETVFNAPSSHVAAVLPSAAINYTLLGDSSAFLEGIAMAAEW